MNVHAKFPHINVFWKGSTHFVMTFVLLVKLTHVRFVNSLKYHLNYLFILEIWCILLIRVMNVHAKFRHINVFWKGGTHFFTALVLGSNGLLVFKHFAKIQHKKTPKNEIKTRKPIKYKLTQSLLKIEKLSKVVFGCWFLDLNN